jgi:hypothetical protein
MTEEIFETEMRAGVPHYVVGQHRAVGEGDLMLLMYVDVMGWAVLLPCHLVDGQWQPGSMIQRVSVNRVTSGWVNTPKSFRLSDAMIEALNNPMPDTPWPETP